MKASRVLFLSVLLLCAGLTPLLLLAQVLAGYTKVGSVTTTTYVDSTVTSGQVWSYYVTATNLAGESQPSNIVTAVTPTTTGTHSNTLTWTASAGATGYNIYRSQVTVPNPPGALGVTSN